MNKIIPYTILLAVLIAIFFSPIIFTIRGIAGNYGDIYLHYYPLKHLVAENIISGKIPLWNPYIFAGQPLLANPQSAVLYPFSIIFYMLPIHLAFNYFIVLHFFLAGIFMYLLLAYLGFSGTSSIVCSITYVFSAFLVFKVPAGHPAALSGYIWFPSIIYLLESIKRSGSYLHIFVLSFAIAFQYLSGHIQPIYTSVLFILLHFIFNRINYWKRLLMAVPAAVILVSIQLIPSLELSQVAETLNWQKLASSYSLPFKNLVNLVLPDFYGNIINGNYIYQANPSYFFELHSLYIGIIPFLLAAAGFYISIKNTKYFWPIIVIAGGFLSLGNYNPAYKFMYWVAPGLQFVRAPARFSYLFITGFIILFAAAWDKYLKKQKNILKLLILLIIIFDLFRYGNGFIYSQDISNSRRKSEITNYIYPMYRMVTEPGVLPADKAMLYHHYNLNGYETIFLQDFTRYLGLQEKEIMSPTGLARMDFNSVLMKGFSVRYNVSTKDIKNRDIFMCFKSGLKLYRQNIAIPLVYFPKTTKLVREESGYDQIEYLKNTKLPPDEEIVVSDIPDNFPRFTEGAKVLSYKQFYNKSVTEVSLNTPGTLVFSEISYPGWKAYYDKKSTRVYRGNKIFKTVFLETAGKTKIYMLFKPVSYILGLYLTLIALLFFVLLAIYFLLEHSRHIFNMPSRIRSIE
ncbi:MAG: YfhO family protein [Elusimicrobia bacterium]|nr:YfhO family protein [Candidatus Liberimonas magnetica]